MILAILVIIALNQSHQSHHGINVIKDRCVLKKWYMRIVIGHYGYKSSFGANKHYVSRWRGRINQSNYMAEIENTPQKEVYKLNFPWKYADNYESW